MSLKKKVVWLPYDFDTAIGINNDGELVFDYQLEDIDTQQSGANVFNGQDSVIWKNIRAAFADELKSMYQALRSSGNLSYAVVEQMFEEHQSKWSEAIFNEDAQFKYVDPFVNSNANYLYMLLGSKAEQRKWWLYNRFRYIDSKYIAGDAGTDTIFLRPYEAEDITLTPYADIYATIKWDATTTQERAERNEPITLECPYQSMNGNIVTIYSSSQLASIGDISPLKVGQIDISNATRLQSLKVGDSALAYDNGNLYSITFGSNVLMQSIDVRNCSGLGDTSIQGHTQQTVDLSGCPIIEDIYFSGTKITGLTLPNGGVIKTLDLPDTITNLTILNQPSITTFSVEGDDYSNISTLRIENCSSAIPVMDILGDMSANSRVRIIGFTTTASSTQDVEDFFDMLDDMRGLDEQGNNTDNAVASGTITGLGTITGAWLAQMNARYPDITITYEHISSNVYFYNGSTLLDTQTSVDGATVTYGGSTPTKTSTAQYSYTFSGWSKGADDGTVDSDALTNITADRNVYACFTSTVRTYTITWRNQTGASSYTTIETDTDVPYGTTPTYNGATPTYNGQTSSGWSPAVTPVTGDQTYTAIYVPVYTATFALSATDSDTGSQKTLQTVQVQEGSTPAYTGATPTTVQGDTTEFTFTGWSPTPAPIYANTTYIAQFQDNRAATIQYLTRNITTYESTTNTKFAGYGLGYATKLTSATSPATTVEEYAFYNDTLLETVDLSATSGAVTIAANAFYGCTKLTHLIIRSSTMATLSATAALTGTPISYGMGAIYVPTALVSTYKANTNWANYYIADIANYPLSDFSTITDSWSTIIANSNYATDYSIGDTKVIDFGTYGKHLMELVALDTDNKADNTGKARMTWLSKTIITTHNMNSTNTTSGGWESTALRAWLKSDIKTLLPSEVQSAIVPVTKVSSTYSSAVVQNGQTTTDDVWIPSDHEIFGTTTYENTGALYTTKFANATARTKYLNGSSSNWWLRSAHSATGFRVVDGGGFASGNNANYGRGVVLGFCL